ncbi:hypothetical protein ACNKHS_08375 [Shigella flexneri]
MDSEETPWQATFPQGQLAQAIPGFILLTQPVRWRMLSRRAIRKARQPLVVEAGTGWGKPTRIGACAAGEKVMISTGSKASTYQLDSRPTDGGEALEGQGRWPSPKGRCNYSASERLDSRRWRWRPAGTDPE